MRLLYSLILVFLLFGCSSPIRKQNEAIRQGVYAVADSSKVGRYDLVDSYSNNLIKIVPPPEKRILIQPFRASYPKIRELQPVKQGEIVKVDINGKYLKEFDTSLDAGPLVVLPERFQNKPVIIENSPEYLKLVNENAVLKKQLEQERDNIAKFSHKVEDVQRENAKIVENASKPKSSWFSGLKWGLGLFSLLGIGGVVLLCIFFPALIPLVINIFGRIFGAVISGANGLIGWISNRFNKH